MLVLGALVFLLLRRGGQNVLLHDLALRAAAADGLERNIHLVRDLLCKRRRLDVLCRDAAFKAGALDLGDGVDVIALVLDERLCLRRQLEGLDVRLLLRGGLFLGGLFLIIVEVGLDRGVRRNVHHVGLERGVRVLAGIADDGDWREDGDGRLRLDNDLEERAVFRRVDGHDALIRVYIKEGLALFDALADLLVPCDKTAFVLRKAKLRHNNNLCHCGLLP